jgi:hypothetical protein
VVQVRQSRTIRFESDVNVRVKGRRHKVVPGDPRNEPDLLDM